MARTKVQSELIATNAISGTIIADNAITATHIATNAISGTLVQSSGIVTDMIASNNVTAAKIVTDAIQTRHIADDQVTGDKLTNNITIAGTLTSTGAFTSPGIDDNANANAITIDSSENVGIGISPVEGASGMQTLHLHSGGGSAYLRLTTSGSGSTAGDGFDLLMTTAEAYVWNRENGNIRFGTNNAESARLTSDGTFQLGTSIGNSTYAGQFNSVANLGSSGANIQTRNGDGNKHYILRGDNNVEYGSVGLTSSTGTGVFQLQGESGIAFRGASAADRMRIDSNGKVGIGTTSPANNLHIFTDAGDEGITIKSTGNTSNAIIFDANRSGAGSSIGEIQNKWNGTTTSMIASATGSDTTNKDDGELIFYTASAGSLVERMRVKNNGGISLTGNHQFNFRASGASNPGNNAVIVFDEVSQGNAASCYNTSTGAYQAAIDGWYMVSVGIRYDSISGAADTYTRPQLRYLPDGGSTWQYPHQGKWVDPIFGTDFGSGDYLAIMYTVPIYLSNGDQIQIMNTGNSTHSVNHNESHFGVIFMG